MKKRVVLLMILVIAALSLNGCAADRYGKQFEMPKKGDTIAVIKTNFGDITVRFFEKEAPKAVENFVTLAKEGYYDGVIFHRVIEDFMIQGGDPMGTGTGGESCWEKPFENEIVEYLSPYRGALCMANSGSDNTNTSQFFIVTCDNDNTTKVRTAIDTVGNGPDISEKKLELYAEHGGAEWLDHQISQVYNGAYQATVAAHTVFGQVIEGMDVVDAISQTEVYSELEFTDAYIDDPAQTEVLQNKPKEDVIIETIEITEYN